MSDVDHIDLRGDGDTEDDPGLERPPELPARDREGKTLLLVFAAIVGLALVVAGAWWLLRGDAPAGDESPPVADAPPAVEEPPPADPVVALPALDQSDALVRELVAALSSHPQLARWLVNDDLLRRTASVVGNVAWGEDPSAHVPFLRPDGPFRAATSAGATTVDPRSWQRYDLAADVFASLDAPGTAALYRRFRPLLAEAYAELGYPGTWDEALRTAVRLVLETPSLPADVALVRDEVTFQYADPQLEALSPAQKLVLRAGPRNAERIVAKVREIASAAGIAR